MVTFDKPGFLYEVEQYAQIVDLFNAADAEAQRLKGLMLAQRKHLKSLLDGRPTDDPSPDEVPGPEFP